MKGERLLSIDQRTAGRAPVSESGFHFHRSAGGFFRGQFMPVSQISDKQFNALRNFSRESSATHNSKPNHLEIRPQLRRQYYE